MTNHSAGGRRKSGYASDSYIEANAWCLALRPKFLRGIEQFSAEANRLSNWAYVETVREHHPEREIW